MKDSSLVSQGPPPALEGDIVDMQIDVYDDNIVNPELAAASPPAPGGTPSGSVVQAEVALFHHAATAAMADELCRLARDVRRRVKARELLPALTALTALGPLHEMLVQQFVTRLMTESAAPPNPPSQVEANGISPFGYL